MKNMFLDMDTNVSFELHKWINQHKDEFIERILPSKHSAIMFDDDGNAYKVAVYVKKIKIDYPEM